MAAKAKTALRSKSPDGHAGDRNRRPPRGGDDPPVRIRHHGVTLWRISGHRLDGAGGLVAAGRWHTQGSRIVYCSPNPATALVEVLVHLEVEVSDLPDRLQYLEIEAPVERARQPSSPAQRAYPGRPRSQPCRRPTAPVIVRPLLGRRICGLSIWACGPRIVRKTMWGGRPRLRPTGCAGFSTVPAGSD